MFGLVATARDAGGLAALDFLEPRDKKTQFDGWKVRCGVYEAANTVEYDKASKVIRDYLRDPRWEKSNGGGVTMQGGTCVRLALSERDWIAVWVCNEVSSPRCSLGFYMHSCIETFHHWWLTRRA